MTFLQKYIRTGILPEDPPRYILRKQFLNYQGIFMNAGALTWILVCLLFHQEWQSLLHVGFLVFSLGNYYYFRTTKNFDVAKSVQTGISIFFPFVFQWSMGGFHASGVAMLASLIALVVAVTYTRIKGLRFWVGIFGFLLIFSVMYDDFFKELIVGNNVNETKELVFLVINISFSSAILFALLQLIVTKKLEAFRNLRNTKSALAETQQMASLGQLVAGIAHEVNTPLGAIKSSAQELEITQEYLSKSTPRLLKSLNEAEVEGLAQMIERIPEHGEVISSKDERVLKRELGKMLEEKGLGNADYHARNLIKAGFREINPQLEAFLQSPNAEALIETACQFILQKRSTQNIQVATEMASRVVKALKTYAHKGSEEEMTLIDLRSNLNTVLTVYGNKLKYGVEIIKEFDEVPSIPGFNDQLNQVWVNLIQNAGQAMNYKGELTLAIKNDGDSVLVSVGDSGPGIPVEIRNKIFEPFFTTKPLGEGTGLGLDIVKQIVERHKGEIWVDCPSGGGAVFFVKLPKQNSQYED